MIQNRKIQSSIGLIIKIKVAATELSINRISLKTPFSIKALFSFFPIVLFTILLP